MRKINLFKKITAQTKRIEYSDLIMKAVCDRRIVGLKINCNSGFDYVDQNNHFLRLLIMRGQVSELYTGSDLLASTPYLQALEEGLRHLPPYKNIQVVFENRCTGVSPSGLPTSPKGCAYASPKRIENAKARFAEFFERKGA